MKKKNLEGIMKVLKRLGTILLCLVFIVTVVADVLAFNVFATPLDKAFPAKVKAEKDMSDIQANALNTAQNIESEGAVLLKNDGSLPLKNDISKINLLGYGAYNIVYGGSGSGGSSYLENRTDFVTAFSEAGIEVNPAIASVYSSNGEEANTFDVNFAIPEPAATEELASSLGEDFKYVGDASFDAMKEYSDTAVIVISRKGGEGNDLPTSMKDVAKSDSDKAKHYLELNDEELSLISKAEETFANVVVLINSGNALELGFLEDEGINAAIWMGDPGDVGTKAVVDILKGNVNPSGRLVDIYPYEVESTPSFYNFDTFEYTNSNDCFKDFESHPAYLIEYQEGIYVGYRYFETRDSFDYTTLEGEEKSGLTYDDVVQYPFGYGLSYTNFSWTVKDITSKKSVDEKDTIEVTVTVKNEGSVAGKDVVELYYNAPYYAEGSGIQKADVVLGAFAKTGIIEPNESEEVTLELPVSDFASYDDGCYYSSDGSWVIEKGDYTLSLRKNSHEVVDNNEFTYTVEDTIVFNDDSQKTSADATAKYVGKRESDKQIATNQFADVAGDVEYLDRDAWTIVPGSSKEATKEQLDAFNNALVVDEKDYAIDGAKEITFGADNNVKLSDLAGKDYDDKKWDKLLDELKKEDYQNILATNGWGSAAIDQIGKPQTYDMDGPAALSYVFDAFIGTVTYKTISYPAAVVLASTWNTDLATDFADSISQEGKAWNISGWYAPGANIHRCAFSGRNFEYYSEDPFLSAQIATAVVKKATENGMYCYMKHFVLNERETWRHYGLCTWASEQAMREIYFKPFEAAVKDGKTTAIMSSYNNLGTTWAGESEALLKNVLRGEWGFVGTVLTDNLEQHGFMSTERAIIHGGTSTLCNGMFASDTVDNLLSNASGQHYLREAAHQYLYTVANSYAVDGKTAMAAWRLPAIIASVALYILSLGGLVIIIYRKKKTV